MVDPDILADALDRYESLCKTMAEALDVDDWVKSNKVTYNDYMKFKADHSANVRIKWQPAVGTHDDGWESGNSAGGRPGYLLMKKWPD